MAIRSVRRFRRVRPLLLITALSASVLAAPVLQSTLASASPAPAPGGAQPATTPSIDSVQHQLSRLVVRNSQLVEKFDRARLQVAARARAATEAQLFAARAAAGYNRANIAFTRSVQAQYESGGVTLGGALLSSDGNDNYLARLQTMNLVSTHDADVVTVVRVARRVSAQASTRAHTLLVRATADRDALGARRDALQHQIAKYRALLDTLTAAQQAAFTRATNPSVTPADISTLTKNVHAPTPGAQRAVAFAMKQVGKPYNFGSAGPGSYDCSGLTMASWAHGGVSLPHSAREQYNYGTHIARNQLQPGDLIFFYQPIGHVTIYIGNGLMVSAPTAGQDVTVVPLDHFNSDYTGATRLP